MVRIKKIFKKKDPSITLTDTVIIITTKSIL